MRRSADHVQLPDDQERRAAHATEQRPDVDGLPEAALPRVRRRQVRARIHAEGLDEPLDVRALRVRGVERDDLGHHRVHLARVGGGEHALRPGVPRRPRRPVPLRIGVAREHPLHLLLCIGPLLVLADRPGGDRDAPLCNLRKQRRVGERDDRAERDPHHGDALEPELAPDGVVEASVADIVVPGRVGRRRRAAGPVRIDQVDGEAVG